MASPWLQGIQVGSGIASDVMNRNLRMQELRSQEAHRRSAERDAVARMGLLLEKRAKEIQEQADMAKAVDQFQALTAPEIPGPDGTMVPNPNKTPIGSAALKAFLPQAKTEQDGMALVAASGLANERERDGLNPFKPTGESVTLPDGSTIQGVMTTPKTFTPVIDPTIESINDPVTGKPRAILRTGTSGAKLLPQDIGERQQRTMLTKWALENAPELMVTDPETGNVSLPTEKFNEAARRAGIPNASKTLLNEQMIAASASFEVGRKLLPLITPENTGVQGKLRSVIVEKGLAQIFPNMKTGSRGEMVATVSNFRASLIRTLRSDGNIGVKELDAIIDGLPTPDEFWSSPQDAKAVMATQIELAAIKGRAAANILGKPIPPFYYKKEEIEELVTSKSISGDDAAKLWNGGAWKFIGEIRADVQK